MLLRCGMLRQQRCFERILLLVSFDSTLPLSAFVVHVVWPISASVPYVRFPYPSTIGALVNRFPAVRTSTSSTVGTLLDLRIAPCLLSHLLRSFDQIEASCKAYPVISFSTQAPVSCPQRAANLRRAAVRRAARKLLVHFKNFCMHSGKPT